MVFNFAWNMSPPSRSPQHPHLNTQRLGLLLLVDAGDGANTKQKMLEAWGCGSCCFYVKQPPMHVKIHLQRLRQNVSFCDVLWLPPLLSYSLLEVTTGSDKKPNKMHI